MQETKKSMKKILSLVLAVIMVVGILAIPSQSQAASKKAKQYVTKITAAKKKVTLTVGKSATVKVTVKGTKKVSKKYTAASSKKKVATVKVTKKGVKITAKKAGKTVITIKTKAKNKKKKILTAKINVTVKAKKTTPAPKPTPVKQDSYTMNKTSASFDSGSTIQLNLLKNGSTSFSDTITWTSSNEKVATVDKNGLVTGQSEGTATITATSSTGNKASATVKISGFVYSRDLKITNNTIHKYIEFTYNKDEVTKEELEAAGYTVNGSTASMEGDYKSAKYSFKKLPKTLEEYKQFPMDTEFQPMAMTISAMATVDLSKYNMQNVDKCPTCGILDYINGPKCPFNKFAEQHLASNVFYNLKGKQNCFFEAATRSNGYSINASAEYPYEFSMYVGPYYIPASDKSIAYGNTPERYMVLISFAGDDSERYIDVYKSGDGKWYSWMDQWKHMGASFRDPEVQW